MKLSLRRMIICSIAAMVLLITGCGSSASGVNIPYTDLGFKSSIDDVVKKYGDCDEVQMYANNIKSYEYPCDYLGKSGTLKFGFNDKDELVKISWQYKGQSQDDTMEVFQNMATQYTSLYGEAMSLDETGSAVWANPPIGILAYGALLQCDFYNPDYNANE